MVQLRHLSGADLDAALEDLAQLRITVFRDWPYLYDGALDYELRYLQVYRESPGAIVVGAFDGERLIGAATGSPMQDHAAEFAAPLRQIGLAVSDIFYGAESVLLPAYRGQGLGHRFFDFREAHARKLGHGHLAFCAVVRPDDHPMRPAAPRSNDVFWRKRGYSPVAGVLAEFSWRDRGDSEETLKPLQFWMRAL